MEIEDIFSKLMCSICKNPINPCIIQLQENIALCKNCAILNYFSNYLIIHSQPFCIFLSGHLIIKSTIKIKMWLYNKKSNKR